MTTIAQYPSQLGKEIIMKREKFSEYELISTAKTILTHVRNTTKNTECIKDINIIIRKISFLQAKWVAIINDIDIGDDDEQV